MKKFTLVSLLLGTSLVAAGCNKDSSEPAKQAPAAAVQKVAPKADVNAAHAHDEHADHAAAGAAPSSLKVLMTQLGVDMAEIGNGFWREDFALIAKHAKAIADHPHVSADERQRLMKALEADFGEFVKGDRHVHDAAQRLHGAAEKSDMAGALKELSTLQAGCVSCHTSFRERLKPATEE